jgi:hypothetical protein
MAGRFATFGALFAALTAFGAIFATFAVFAVFEVDFAPFTGFFTVIKPTNNRDLRENNVRQAVRDPARTLFVAIYGLRYYDCDTFIL